MVAGRGRGGLHADRLRFRARRGRQIPHRPALQPLPGGPRRGGPVPRGPSLRILHPAGSGRSGRSRGDAPASRLQRHPRTPVAGGAHPRWHHSCGRQLGDPHGPAQRQLRAPAVRGAGVSGPARIPGGSAGAALRRVRLDAALSVRRAGGGGAYSARRRGAHDPRGARGRAPSLGCRGRRPGVGYSARNRLRQPPGRTCRDASGGQRSWQRRRARTRRGAEQLLPGDGARLARGRECALPARHLLRGRPGRLERALADLRAIGGRAYGTGARPGPAGDLGRPCRRRRAPAPHRPLPPLEREHGRGVDALDSRGVWHRPHEPV